MTIEFDHTEIEPSPDRRSSTRSRRRLAAGVAAAMLVAAAGGVGYGIGRNVSDDAVTLAPADTPATEAPAPAATSPEAAAPLSPSTTVEMMSEDSNASMNVSGSMGASMFGAEPLTLLAERNTDDGFTLRAHLGQLWDNGTYDGGYPNGWTPASWCNPNGQLRVALGGNGVIDTGSVPWWSEPRNGTAVSVVPLGAADGNPRWVVVAQAPVDVTNVTVTFDDGATDTVAPTNGVALLSVPGQPAEQVDESDYSYWTIPPVSYTVIFDGASGPTEVTSDGVGGWGDPEYRAACEPPPPALPEAGEQPADPASAEAEIRAAMTALYAAVGTDDVGSDLLDDATGVAEARAQVQAGGYADDAAGATATIDELVFTTPSESWFRYSIDTPGNDFSNRYGIAVLIDGVWKITRSTVCQDLAMAGGDCGGNWQGIYPPGTYGTDDYSSMGD